MPAAVPHLPIALRNRSPPLPFHGRGHGLFFPFRYNVFMPKLEQIQKAIAQAGTMVDLALVLAVDCSSSVDEGDYRLQMDGIAKALRNPPLYDAIAAGPYGRIALTLVHWSNLKSQVVAIAWGVIASKLDLEAAARRAETVERQWKPGGTGLAAAIDFSAALLRTLPAVATRRIIDVSGDGEDNEGGDVPRARRDALAQGITINGLPILYGSSTLKSYYRKNVIGGPGAFIMPARNMQSFADAMTQKLLREVAMKATA